MAFCGLIEFALSLRLPNGFRQYGDWRAHQIHIFVEITKRLFRIWRLAGTWNSYLRYVYQASLVEMALGEHMNSIFSPRLPFSKYDAWRAHEFDIFDAFTEFFVFANVAIVRPISFVVSPWIYNNFLLCHGL